MKSVRITVSFVVVNCAYLIWPSLRSHGDESIVLLLQKLSGLGGKDEEEDGVMV